MPVVAPAVPEVLFEHKHDPSWQYRLDFDKLMKFIDMRIGA